MAISVLECCWKPGLLLFREKKVVQKMPVLNRLLEENAQVCSVTAAGILPFHTEILEISQVLSTETWRESDIQN